MASDELKSKIKAQIAFYFSDSNYPRDKFLRGKAAENDGWVPIDVIATFSRMKQMTTDLALVVELAKSLDDLVVSPDGTKVKRKQPIPEKDTLNERSVYVKGLPAIESGVSIESISDFFSKLGKVLSVRLRRDQDKAFKGKAYVEFSSQEEAEKVAATKDIAWGEEKAPLEVYTKTEYFNVRKQKTKAAKEDKKRKREDEEVASDKKDNFSTGLVVEIKNIPSATERDHIKDILAAAGPVRYVDFHGKEQGIAFVRFVSAESAKTALEDVNAKKMKIAEADITARILEGEEEKKYWDEKVTPYTTAKKGNFRGNSRGRGGYGGNKRARKE